MNKIPIVYMITDLSTGGTPTALLRLLSGIDRTKYDPTVISFYSKDSFIFNEIMDLNIPVIDLGLTQKWRIDAFWKIKKILKEIHPTILHTWLFHANITGRIFGRFNKVPLIIASRRSTNIGGSWREILMRETSGMNDKIIAVSEAARKAEIDSSKVPHDKVVTIYNGLDPSPFRTVSNEARQTLRNSMGIPDDVILLGSVGRLHPAKGFNDLITAMELLGRKTRSTQLVIVGEGELKDQLKHQVQKSNLDGRIMFTDIRNDIPEILSAFDIFLSPSLWEGLPNVVLEAMAAGKPVVATSVGGTPEVVVDGLTGLLVPPHKPKALANSTLFLCENPKIQKSMGQAGRERVIKHFSIEQMVKQTEELYHELMVKKGLL
jgi:glycosyltransferase involved in cell wall biosynthesis